MVVEKKEDRGIRFHGTTMDARERLAATIAIRYYVTRAGLRSVASTVAKETTFCLCCLSKDCFHSPDLVSTV